MSKEVKRCSYCHSEKSLSFFAKSSWSSDGHQTYCKLCKREYYREYILPALRGRGHNRVLPAWVKGLVRPPEFLPSKVIRLQDYFKPDTNRRAKRLVVGE